MGFSRADPADWFIRQRFMGRSSCIQSIVCHEKNVFVCGIIDLEDYWSTINTFFYLHLLSLRVINVCVQIEKRSLVFKHIEMTINKLPHFFFSFSFEHFTEVKKCRLLNCSLSFSYFIMVNYFHVDADNRSEFNNNAYMRYIRDIFVMHSQSTFIFCVSKVQFPANKWKDARGSRQKKNPDQADSNQPNLYPRECGKRHNDFIFD